MLRDVKLVLMDMIDACERVLALLPRLERHHFDDWSIERLAVERLLLILGEGIDHVD